MPIASDTRLAQASQSNLPAPIRERVAAGRVPLAGPLLLVAARTVLWFTFQCLLALILFALHCPAPFRAAGNWWMVYGTFSDLCCLLGMWYFTGREGIRLRDLIGPIRMRQGRDLFLGCGILVLSYPLLIGGGYLATAVVCGSTAKVPMEFILHRHSLPLWATVYTLTVWWIIQSATEEMTYQGYALPRLQVLTGRTWIAVTIVGFFWAAQHCMVPFVADWHYLAYRFLMFLPLVLVWMPLYLRMRRLAPFILAHWPMDFAIATMTGIR
ncbi:MAG: CPBP family intramembrane glutamic endopeptidase [Terracidiphilus sp.]